MSNFSLKGIAEQESTFTPFVKILPGIHKVQILDIFYQPEGQSVKDEMFKGQLSTFDSEQIRIKFKVLETVTEIHGSNKDEEGTISVFCPKETNNDGKRVFEGEMSRLIHIFSNMVDFDNKEKAITHLQAIEATSFKDLAGKIIKVIMSKDRKAKFKLVSNKSGKTAVFPNYYQGFVECYDLSPSKLTFDVKDKFPTAPVNAENAKADNTYTFPDTDQSKSSPKTEDELPPF